MQLDPLLEQRRDVARRVTQRLAGHTAVAGVIVFGSVATATVDKYSDVDMLVICQPDLITPAERVTILRELGSGWMADASQHDGLFAIEDKDGTVDEILVTVHYQTVTWIETVLDQVINQGAISTDLCPFRPYTVAGLLRQGWLLYDAYRHVEQWRERIKQYPPRLKQNILQHFIPILQEQTEELVATANRGIGPLNFLFHLDHSVDALTSILYALNEIYDPADRRATQTVWPLLHSLPPNFATRLNTILEGPFDAEGMKLHARRYAELVEEVMGMTR